MDRFTDVPGRSLADDRCLYYFSLPFTPNQMAPLEAASLIMRILFAFERLTASLKPIFFYGLINYWRVVS